MSLHSSNVLNFSAHTEASAKALSDVIKTVQPRGPLALVVGMANDKEHLAFAEQLLSGKIFPTLNISNPHASDQLAYYLILSTNSWMPSHEDLRDTIIPSIHVILHHTKNHFPSFGARIAIKSFCLLIRHVFFFCYRPKTRCCIADRGEHCWRTLPVYASFITEGDMDGCCTKPGHQLLLGHRDDHRRWSSDHRQPSHDIPVLERWQTHADWMLHAIFVRPDQGCLSAASDPRRWRHWADLRDRLLAHGFVSSWTA